MAPLTYTGPQSNNDQGRTVTITMVLSIGGAIVLTSLVFILLLIRRRRREAAADLRHRAANDLHYHAAYDIRHRATAPPPRTHKSNLSDSSMKPLLMEESNADWDNRERFSQPKRRVTDEVFREVRDSLSNNPNGLYHIPSLHGTMGSESPAPSSSGCLPHVSELHVPPNTASELRAPPTPGRPQLPPLSIPDYPYAPPSYRAAVSEGSSPVQPSSSSTSSPSVYSQPTAKSVPTTPDTHPRTPGLPQELVRAREAPTSEDGLNRGDTQVVGTLLKARAKRNLDGLIRDGTKVSRIERTGSIKSVASAHPNSRRYGKPYRPKRRGTSQLGEMEALMEAVKAAASQGSSLSRSDSSASAHWDPSLLVKLPARAAGLSSMTKV